jgi:hypothetical protein
MRNWHVWQMIYNDHLREIVPQINRWQKWCPSYYYLIHAYFRTHIILDLKSLPSTNTHTCIFVNLIHCKINEWIKVFSNVVPAQNQNPFRIQCALFTYWWLIKNDKVSILVYTVNGQYWLYVKQKNIWYYKFSIIL